MFFILSKTISFLVMPFTVVIILLFFPHFGRIPFGRNGFFGAAWACFFFSQMTLSRTSSCVHGRLKRRPYEDMSPHELGIVLTGATVPMLKPDDRVYFHRGADRVTHTVQLYKLGLIKKILISGGTGALTNVDEPEANKFKKAMVMMGVPDGDIMIENQTRNTYESAVAVRKMLDSLQFKAENCLLITSAFHMRRSLACYRKANWILSRLVLIFMLIRDFFTLTDC